MYTFLTEEKTSLGPIRSLFTLFSSTNYGDIIPSKISYKRTWTSFMKIDKKFRQNANALKKIFKPIMGGARWMIFFRSLSCDVVTTNLLRSKRCVKIN